MGLKKIAWRMKIGRSPSTVCVTLPFVIVHARFSESDIATAEFTKHFNRLRQHASQREYGKLHPRQSARCQPAQTTRPKCCLWLTDEEEQGGDTRSAFLFPHRADTSTSRCVLV